MLTRDFWRNRSVFLTGHTGFKGGWLATWLIDLGANVRGLALPPDTTPSYYELCRLERRMVSELGDVRDIDVLAGALARSGAEIAFHMAAQALVRRGYREPVSTFATNVMGTVHFLEAVRRTPSVRVAVVITSDKCYATTDAGAHRGYRETDPLGGHDPYSASKGCAEIVTDAYRRSFFAQRRETGVASVRAGNVIGGGDWGEDRVVPDGMRAFPGGNPLIVRNPHHVRPWQHVLDALSGYLMLAQRLHRQPDRWSGAWNFGPPPEDAAPVSRLADLLIREWGSARWEHPGDLAGAPETHRLTLDCAKARALLGWRPRLDLDTAVRMTVAWYREALSRDNPDMFDASCCQIRNHEAI